MSFRAAKKSDLDKIQAILKDVKLPYQDCAKHVHNFVVLELNDNIIGVGGIELYGDIALLRSIAVEKKYRNQGWGDAVFLEIKEYAFQSGAKELYLLTETAEQYLTKRGFIKVDRDMAPQAIKQTEQFSGLCSLSAIVMKYS